jgi:hypothetical protein
MNSNFPRRCAAMAVMALLIPADSRAGDAATTGAGSEIAGQVADIHDSTDSSGYRFQVALRNLSYVGQSYRTLLERKEDGSFTIWVAFRDIRLTIGSVSLAGQPGSAMCGPMALHIGHQREIWVAFDFARGADAPRSPLLNDSRPPLTLTGSRCQIAHDNWTIGSPAWVRTSGFFMSDRKVVSGVRAGLAGKRERIELELQRIAFAVLGKSCTESGEAPADRDAFEAAVAARLVRDGHLAATPSPAGSVSFPLAGFVQERPAPIRPD